MKFACLYPQNYCLSPYISKAWFSSEFGKLLYSAMIEIGDDNDGNQILGFDEASPAGGAAQCTNTLSPSAWSVPDAGHQCEHGI